MHPKVVQQMGAVLDVGDCRHDCRYRGSDNLAIFVFIEYLDVCF